MTATATACPSWCAAHPREHANGLHVAGDVTGEALEGDLWAIGVSVEDDEPATLHVDGAHVTPQQARALASAIINACDAIEGHDSQRETLRRNVGASVAAAMAERGVTVEQLAPAIGRPEGHVWRRLAGASSFSVDDLVSIAHVLEVDPGTLIA